MKKMIRLVMIGATVALLALPVAAQDQCSEEKKTAMYNQFREIYKNDQAKAYELAKTYLACPVSTPDEAQQKIIEFLKKWSMAYEAGMKPIRLRQLLYTEKKYPEAFALGKEILATEPDNLKVLVDLGANGYLVAPLNNPQLVADSLNYAKRALQLLDAGKTVEDWQELQSKDIAVAYLNYTIGSLSLEKEPANALKHLIKSAQFETPLKKSPFTYALLAVAYETGPYAKQSEVYKATYGGKDETPESKLALANINQIVERMIDGYARAVALAGNDAQFAKQKAVWLESLTTWYKYLHNGSDAGMSEMIAGIVSKPLPPEPTPLTSLPPSTPATTPIGNTGAAPASGNGASSTTTGTTQPASKPVKPGTPDRPRNRR